MRDWLFDLTLGLLAIAGALWICSRQPLHAQERGPATALVIGSALDLTTTLHRIGTDQNAHEANPLLAHGGTAGLVAGKAVTTAALLYAMRHMGPTWGRVVGYAGGAALAGLAVRNERIGR